MYCLSGKISKRGNLQETSTKFPSSLDRSTPRVIVRGYFRQRYDVGIIKQVENYRRKRKEKLSLKAEKISPSQCLPFSNQRNHKTAIFII